MYRRSLVKKTPFLEELSRGNKGMAGIKKNENKCQVD